MKLTKKLLEQMIEEIDWGTYNPDTGEFEYNDSEEPEEEEEEYKGKVRGIPGGKRAMRDIVLPHMQKPDASSSAPVKRYPAGHPLAGKPVTKGWMDQVWADMQREKEADVQKYQQRAKAKGYMREEKAGFELRKSEIVEMIKEEIKNILNGD